MAYSFSYSSRSSRGGRGGFSYSSSYYSQARSTSSYNLPPDRDIKEGLLPSPIQVLSLPTFKAGTAADIEGVEYIGSYNWTGAKVPTIIVPGSPPEWKARSMPFTLSPDEGVRFKDQNGFRMPSSVLLPLFSAVDAVGKEVDWPSIDFITDRNGLRKLMRWIDIGTSAKDFRIDMELAGERTVLLNRWEANTQDVANGKTFGFSFEHATTSAASGCEASTAHHRIVKYDFFGLKTIVRFEVDACLPSAKPRPSKMSAATLDDLTDSLAGLNIDRERKATTASTTSSPTKGKDNSSSAPALKIIRAGSEVPQSSIVELTTRSVMRINELDWTEIYPQLYLSQTPWYYIGVHSRGTFTEVRKSNLTSEDMAAQRRQAKESVQKLGQVLEMIQEVAIAHGVEKLLSLVCQQGVLRVYKRVAKESCLPGDVRERFDSE